MNNLYTKLAWTNIKNNRMFYLPYLLAGMFSAMMFYCVNAMAASPDLANIRGGSFLRELLGIGLNVVAIFVCIFLFYTNSFLMKRRKKELGIYHILGMEKKHVAKVMFREKIMSYIVSVGGGLLLGIVFHKLLAMTLYSLTGLEESIRFYVSVRGCAQTALLFGIVYLASFLWDLGQIHAANPMELLRGGNVGEREPKTKRLMALAGVICVGAGYWIAFTTKNPLEAIMMFFAAVVLVVIGTYLLFTAGSIAFLKRLRKNKKYYYQTKHFTTVSGMIYRMKQNAVGLANICILSTMVLVMISTTVSMYAGIKGQQKERFPAEYMGNFYYNWDSPLKEKDMEVLVKNLTDEAQADGRTVNEYKGKLSSNEISMVQQENALFCCADMSEYKISDIHSVEVMRKQSFEEYGGEKLPELKKGEMAIAGIDFPYDTITFNGKEYSVVKNIKTYDSEKSYLTQIVGICSVVVSEEDFYDVMQSLKKSTEEIAWAKELQMMYEFGMDTDGTKDERVAFANRLREKMETMTAEGEAGNYTTTFLESSQEGYENFLSLNGGLLFLGLFLGIMFLMVTVLIIYYKQISEGYEDRERFVIMKKIGMSNEEVKTAIRSQVKTVFFLPLVTAMIHLVAAFPILQSLLEMMYLRNTMLFAGCLAATAGVFALIYLIVFRVTSKTYYKIVNM